MKWIVLIAVLCLPVSASASAIQRSAIEITAEGGFDHQSFSDVDGSVSTLRAKAGFLRATSNVIQLGAQLTLNHQSLDLGSFGETDGGSAQLDGLFRVNFGSSERTIPYAQAGAGIVIWAGDLEGEEETFVVPQLALGVRFMVHEIASLNLSAGWTRELNALGTKDFDANTYVVQFGFSVFPRGVDAQR
jgi:hypothetical protein